MKSDALNEFNRVQSTKNDALAEICRAAGVDDILRPSQWSLDDVKALLCEVIVRLDARNTDAPQDPPGPAGSGEDCVNNNISESTPEELSPSAELGRAAGAGGTSSGEEWRKVLNLSGQLAMWKREAEELRVKQSMTSDEKLQVAWHEGLVAGQHTLGLGEDDEMPLNPYAPDSQARKTQAAVAAEARASFRHEQVAKQRECVLELAQRWLKGDVYDVDLQTEISKLAVFEVELREAQQAENNQAAGDPVAPAAPVERAPMGGHGSGIALVRDDSELAAPVERELASAKHALSVWREHAERLEEERRLTGTEAQRVAWDQGFDRGIHSCGLGQDDEMPQNPYRAAAPPQQPTPPAVDPAIIRAAEGVVLEPGEYYIVEVDDTDPRLKAGSIARPEKCEAARRLARHYNGTYAWLFIDGGPSTWVTAVRRVEQQPPQPESVVARCARRVWDDGDRRDCDIALVNGRCPEHGHECKQTPQPAPTLCSSCGNPGKSQVPGAPRRLYSYYDGLYCDDCLPKKEAERDGIIRAAEGVVLEPGEYLAAGGRIITEEKAEAIRSTDGGWIFEFSNPHGFYAQVDAVRRVEAKAERAPSDEPSECSRVLGYQQPSRIIRSGDIEAGKRYRIAEIKADDISPKHKPGDIVFCHLGALVGGDISHKFMCGSYFAADPKEGGTYVTAVELVDEPEQAPVDRAGHDPNVCAELIATVREGLPCPFSAQPSGPEYTARVHEVMAAREALDKLAALLAETEVKP